MDTKNDRPTDRPEADPSPAREEALPAEDADLGHFGLMPEVHKPGHDLRHDLPLMPDDHADPTSHPTRPKIA